MTVLLCIPVKNEATVLQSSLEKLLAFINTQPQTISWQLVIADNGSTDDTGIIAKDFIKEHPTVQYFYIQTPGRGIALKTAWEKFSADAYGYIDVDLDIDPEGLQRAVQAIVEGQNIVIGSKAHVQSIDNRPLVRKMISRTANYIVRKVLRIPFTDTQCGLKIIDSATKEKLLPLLIETGWFLDTELVTKGFRAGLNIKEIPITVSQNPSKRRSHFNPFKSLSSFIACLIRLRK